MSCFIRNQKNCMILPFHLRTLITRKLKYGRHRQANAENKNINLWKVCPSPALSENAICSALLIPEFVTHMHKRLAIKSLENCKISNFEKNENYHSKNKTLINKSMKIQLIGLTNQFRNDVQTICVTFGTHCSFWMGSNCGPSSYSGLQKRTLP